MLSKKSRKTLALTLGLATLANILPTIVMPMSAYADSGAPILTIKCMTQRTTDSGMMLTWEKATDSKTPQNKLRYYLYQGENNDYGSSISDWEKNGKLLNEGGTLDSSKWNLTGLNANSNYTFMLVVEDEDGNKTAYEREGTNIKSEIKDVVSSESKTVVNSNSGAPILGQHKSMNEIDEDKFVWEKATDDKTPQNKLRYYLYQAEDNNYGTNISDWEKNAKLLNEGGTLDFSEWKITGLKDDSAYAFMLVVEDEDGNKTAYERALIDIKSVTKDVGDKEKFANAKAKALEFMSTYNFTPNMSWGDFTNALEKELSAYGITGVGDSGAMVDKNTGVVTASIFLYMDYGERYIFPFTKQISDGNSRTANATWNQNSDGNWKLTINGQAAVGWQQVGGKWYYLNQSGIMQTGWFKDTNGNWYCLNSNGEMACNETVDGYYVNADGVWVG